MKKISWGLILFPLFIATIIYLLIFLVIMMGIEYSVVVSLGYENIPEVMYTPAMEQLVFITVWNQVEIYFYIFIFVPILLSIQTYKSLVY